MVPAPTLRAPPHSRPDVIRQVRVADLYVGLDDAVLADGGAALEVDVGVNNRVPADAYEKLDVGGFRVHEGDALLQGPGVEAALQGLPRRGQFGPAVDAQEVLPVRVH